MRITDIIVYSGIFQPKGIGRPHRHQGMTALQYMQRNVSLLVNLKRPFSLIQHCNGYLDQTGWLALAAKVSTLDENNFQRQIKNWFRCWNMITAGVK